MLQYLLIALLISGCVTYFFACKPSANNAGASMKDSIDFLSPKDTTPINNRLLTRAEIEERLAIIAKSPPPAKLNAGAMCYEMAAPPKRADYVCPICGNKTLYTDSDAKYVLSDIPKARSCSTFLANYGITVVENNFCQHCNHNPNASKYLSIIVKLNNEPERKIDNITVFDLRLLSAFFSGSLVYKDEYDFETPLSKYLERLNFLLGTTNQQKN